METIQIRQHLHRYIDKAVDEQIKAIYTLLEANIEAAQDRVNVEQYNKEIEASEQEYEKGNYINQSEFTAEIKKW